MEAQKVQQPDGLIGVLLDQRAEFGDRDDAAMDLGAFDETQAFDALFSIASDPREDSDLQERCGESLAEICSRRANFDTIQLSRLCSAAQHIFAATLKQRNEPGNA